MKRNPEEKNRGFSLIELIIAIAILVILTGLLAPQFMKYIERARKAKCLNNQDVILEEYQVRMIDAEHIEDIDDAKTLMEQVISDIGAECPSGGVYQVKIIRGDRKRSAGADEGWLELSCTKHGGDGEVVSSDPMIVEADRVYDSMKSFLNVDPAEVLKILKQADPTLTYFSNDSFRKYLCNVVYGGTWPKFDMSTLPSGFSDKQFYIQTYTTGNKGNWKEAKEDNIIIFANTNSTASGNWNTNLIYHPTEKQWYMASKIGDEHTVYNKKWSDMEKEIQDGWWIKVP